MTAVSIKELASTMITSVETSATVHNVNQTAAYTYAKPSSSCVFVVFDKNACYFGRFTVYMCLLANQTFLFDLVTCLTKAVITVLIKKKSYKVFNW